MHVFYRSLFDRDILLTAGCANIRTAVAIVIACFITPTPATRDVTATPTHRAAGSVAPSLTCCWRRSYRKEGKIKLLLLHITTPFGNLRCEVVGGAVVGGAVVGGAVVGRLIQS